MKVRDVMMKGPVTLPVDATIHEAAVAMDRNSVGAVVVVDDGRPVGMVTDRDLVVRALARWTPPDARVDSVMSAGVVCVEADVELNSVTAILSAHPFRRVPVVDADRVVGVVTLDDLIVRLVHDLNEATKGVVAQLWFAHPEPQPPAMAS
jgi:CBS domain-containing protein